MKFNVRWVAPALIVGMVIGGVAFSQATFADEWKGSVFGPGGMMGGQTAIGDMMGGFGYGQTQEVKPVQTMEEAKSLLEQYMAGLKDSNLELAEMMEFSNHFYAELRENDTGMYGMELIVDKATGRIYPEMGPNMMWNLKYSKMGGMMGGQGMMGVRNQSEQQTAEKVTPEKSLELAQKYLDRNMPGVAAAEPHEFYGYYTLHTKKDDKIVGMLSVNSTNGSVFYHTWHGDFVQIDQTHEE